MREKNAHTPYSIEIGFFGGTFTALPEPDFQACLHALQSWRQERLVARARCSTRPDADPARLTRLKDAGVDTVELGIQSFDSAALRCSQRGYDAATALRACAAVRAAGLQLGVQLLPGMPGVTPEIFVRDVALALDAGAQLLRFYPCQVLEGTALAHSWRAGEYTPWTLEHSVDALAQGWLLAQARGVPVIRMGLAPEPGLEDSVLAGPRHPALGSMVQAEALCRTVEQTVEQHLTSPHRAANGAAHEVSQNLPPLHALHVPRHCRGFFWGQGGALRPRWLRMGIEARTLFFHDAPEIHLHFA